MTTVPKARQTLIEGCQGLVRSLAVKIHRKMGSQGDLDDLIAYGQVGLAEAAADFNPDRGSQFSTYAYYRVRGAIYDGLSKMNWGSRARYNQVRNDQIAGDVLEADSVSASNSETATVDDDAKWLVAITRRLTVVCLAINSEGGSCDTLADEHALAPPSQAAAREIYQRLHGLIDALPDEERTLVRSVYFDGMTLNDAALQLGVSKSWASRMHARTLDKLAISLRKLGVAD
jgi:RNA polymerase sigma factor for flagellar operon FliA